MNKMDYNNNLMMKSWKYCSIGFRDTVGLRYMGSIIGAVVDAADLPFIIVNSIYYETDLRLHALGQPWIWGTTTHLRNYYQ
jgi:hypothetical protein